MASPLLGFLTLYDLDVESQQGADRMPSLSLSPGLWFGRKSSWALFTVSLSHVQVLLPLPTFCSFLVTTGLPNMHGPHFLFHPESRVAVFQLFLSVVGVTGSCHYGREGGRQWNSMHVPIVFSRQSLAISRGHISLKRRKSSGEQVANTANGSESLACTQFSSQMYTQSL